MSDMYTGIDVIDADHWFVVNASTREITSKQPQKNILMQNDHNSERFTFEVPRFIEGRDLGQCNLVRVYYRNGRDTGFYTVTDLGVYPFLNDTLICSWLISRSATANVGALSFMLKFAQLNDDQFIEYAWSTKTYDQVEIIGGIEGSGTMDYEYTVSDNEM
jgi:hypothetical protein